jgi:hypothetical protein
VPTSGASKVRLLNRTCPDGSSVRQKLAAVSFDAMGNPTSLEPEIQSMLLEYDSYKETSSKSGFNSSSGYLGSRVTLAHLSTEQDSIVSRISDGTAVRFVTVVRDNTPCP